MSDGSKPEYEDAVRQLNQLHRCARPIDQILQNPRTDMLKQIPDMYTLLNELSITQDDLDKLLVIHVTGTKGKGSTCAYIESILRHSGYKTLLFSSPHIIETRERISLNGQPMSYKSFAEYFWEIYNQLKHLKDEDNTLMHFYNFLAVMGLYVAIKETQLGHIDAVIIEGMLGGEYDTVNIFNDKMVCGVTSLGLDHVELLGETIEEIAWHKGGIFRKNAPAFTSPQPDEAMQVLKDRAKERQTMVSLCPSLDQLGSNVDLGMEGNVQKLNAAIALQMAREWIYQKSNNKKEVDAAIDTHCRNMLDPLTRVEREALKSCKPPGKDHVVKQDDMTFYLDGAHTLESLQNCRDWFEKKAEEESMAINGFVKRILIFYITPDRDVRRLLQAMKNYPFDVVMCPVHVTDDVETSIDHPLKPTGLAARIQAAHLNKQIWDEMQRTAIQNGTQQSIYCRSIVESFRWLSEYRGVKDGRRPYLQVLVTGSPGFIGKYLRFLAKISENSKTVTEHEKMSEVI